jgi:hypothetical protein
MSIKMFTSRVFIILTILAYSEHVHSQYTGLRFSGHEVPLDQRTGLNLTPDKPIEFRSNLRLEFELKLEPNRVAHFGYIFRAVVDGQNIDLIYKTNIPSRDNFNLVIGNAKGVISFKYPYSVLTGEWVPVLLEIDGKGNSIRLEIGDEEFEQEYLHKQGKSTLRLFFGAHRYNHFKSTDLPNMNIREISISKNFRKRYYWPLDQSDGNIVKEVISNFNGRATNPNWIISLYTNWRVMDEFYLPGELKFAYNENERKLEICQEDSMYSYDIQTNKLTASFPGHNLSPDNRYNLIFDKRDDQLIYYSTDLHLKCVLHDASSFDVRESQIPILTVYLHHNSMLHPDTKQLYVFGGYGQLTYSNLVLVYNDLKERWDTVNYSGNFYPRYLAGMGYNPSDGKAYILGGYGSTMGEQAISPDYYYELLTYSFDENRFETVAEYSDSQQDFCFARSLYIDTVSNTLYGLKFSKYETEPEVQAVAISLDDYSITYVGDTFTFQFLDIKSTLDLYYETLSKKLIAVTTYLDHNRTRLTLREISYPPKTIEYIGDEHTRSGKSLLITGIILGLTVLSGLSFYLLRKRRKQLTSGSVEPLTDGDILDANYDNINNLKVNHRPGSIILFGGFQVFDKTGKDITNAFTPRLKEMLLYILLHSLKHDKGVSSRTLDEVFWFDKSAESARNNRAVNIGKLKTLLEQVGECKISKDTGYWKFEFTPSDMHVDYYDYLKLSDSKLLNTKEGMKALLKIVRPGPVLQNIEAEWLDNYKSEISNDIIDSIIGYITGSGMKDEPDFIIHLANSVFHFDPVSEESMIIKCKQLVKLGKHSLAKKAYERFVKEYKNLYGEVYPKSFNAILEDKII